MPRAAPGRASLRAVALVAGVVLLGAALPARPSALRSSTPPTTTAVPPRRPAPSPARPLGPADGAVPRGTTVFDDRFPAVARLDPALRAALRQAATVAAAGGVPVVVESGWRSRAYQAALRRDAVGKYGSEAAAARWVATPDASAHVTGDAVDLGPAAATAWLASHGARFGLCRIYDNEPWHYELRVGAAQHGCPRRYPDAAHDPRAVSGS
jgi:hypothetical protein